MHVSCKSLDQVMTEWIVTVLAMSRTINDVLSKQNLLVANNFGRVVIVWTIVKYNIFAVTINYRKLYHWCIDFLFAKTLWLEITKQLDECSMCHSCTLSYHQVVAFLFGIPKFFVRFLLGVAHNVGKYWYHQTIQSVWLCQELGYMCCSKET
mgnify:CR=1 FL=1